MKIIAEYDHQAHDDLHTLKRHAEIKGDPKRHGAALALANKEAEALKKIRMQKPKPVGVKTIRAEKKK